MTNEQIVATQVAKVVADKGLPTVKVCRCGHPDYYHLDYVGKCYSENPDHKDHEREGETLKPCTCKGAIIVIDTSKPDPIIVKGVFSAS